MTTWFPPQGAELTAHGVRYFVWAPKSSRVSVEIYTSGGSIARTVDLVRAEDGYFRGTDPLGKEGDTYKIRPSEDGAFPAPGSHWQPEGVHGPSAVLDGNSYPWQDAQWRRPPFRDLVIYELHIGTFSPEGTFRGAIGKLPYLSRLGVNAIEIMPISDFPGDRNWGYDGVQPYAPARCYGTPDDLRSLVDAAHQLGIAVILDVVYNHFGPAGNYLTKFSDDYFEEVDKTPWGSAVNFGYERSQPVRDFFTANVMYWMDQFHFDGFRLDATHAIFDPSERHILADLAQLVRERDGYIIAEDERNEARIISPRDEGGFGFNAVWADDFHHVIEVATIDASVYSKDFKGELKELAEALQHGWVYQGQVAPRHGAPRGTPCGHLPPERFVFCISNHDQVGNRAFGERLNHLVKPATYRVASALLLLTPYTPMLFMGQEWAASSPFQYFTDHDEELGRLVEKGRREEFKDAFANAKDAESVPSPQAEETFQRSKLNWAEVESEPHAKTLALYQELLRLRRENSAFRPRERGTWKVEILENSILALRLSAPEEEWLVLADLQGGHTLPTTSHEICRLSGEKAWRPVLSTEENRFGGDRTSLPQWSQSFEFAVPELLVYRA